jgi:hypothetical protein
MNSRLQRTNNKSLQQLNIPESTELLLLENDDILPPLPSLLFAPSVVMPTITPLISAN